MKTELKQSASEVSGVPAGAKQGTDIQAQRGWVEATVWNERMLAALGNGVKGGKWFSLSDKVSRPETLASAWRHVERNRGASGVDGQSVAQFGRHAQEYLEEVGAALKSGRYRPEAVRRVELEQGAGKRRGLGIPTVKDRVVQTALKFVMEPIFEREFVSASYGFRPGRGCKDALREVDRLLKAGYVHVVDADVANYFDSIPRTALMGRVRERISDGSLLALIEAFLSQDVMRGLERWRPTQGTPQGAVISPLLANIYLHPLDVQLTEGGYQLVRYADDFVVLCRTAEEAHAALAEVAGWVKTNGLSLHPDKTHVGDCRRLGQGFDFLGYRFEAGRRRVRRKSLLALREKVRSKTSRLRGDSLACIIADLNSLLRGWFGYFKHAHRWDLGAVDGFIRRRLRAVLRRHEHRRGQGRCGADHQRWPNAFFAAQGLFTLLEAHARASQSR